MIAFGSVELLQWLDQAGAHEYDGPGSQPALLVPGGGVTSRVPRLVPKRKACGEDSASEVTGRDSVVRLTVSCSGPGHQLRGNVLMLVWLARGRHGPVTGSLGGPAFLVPGHAAKSLPG